MYRTPLVSIIIPAYRCEKFIKTCLDSILSQTYKNIEVIIVYDPSPDNTLEIIKKVSKTASRKIKVFVNKVKTKPSVARNIGLLHAKGDFVAFCDADDFFHRKKIELQVKELLKNRNVGLVYTDVVQVDEANRMIRKVKTYEWDPKLWINHRFITFSSIMTYLKLAKKVGGFDRRLDAIDDFDFLLKLSKITNFSRIPKYLTFYRVHSQNLSKNELKTIKNRVKILAKHGFVKKVYVELFNYFVKVKILYTLNEIRKSLF